MGVTRQLSSLWLVELVDAYFIKSGVAYFVERDERQAASILHSHTKDTRGYSASECKPCLRKTQAAMLRAALAMKQARARLQNLHVPLCVLIVLHNWMGPPGPQGKCVLNPYSTQCQSCMS